MFDGAAEDFMRGFDFRKDIGRVVMDVTHAHIRDVSSVQALDMAATKVCKRGALVDIAGMNAASQTLVDRLSLRREDDPSGKMPAHER